MNDPGRPGEAPVVARRHGERGNPGVGVNKKAPASRAPSADPPGPDPPGFDPLVVGIGASAGGLEAYKQFFAHMPADNDMAFLLVQHLAPDHQSMLAELLGRCTSMPVAEAADGEKMQAGHVYVIPPDATLTVSDGALRVAKKKTELQIKVRKN